MLGCDEVKKGFHKHTQACSRKHYSEKLLPLPLQKQELGTR